MSEGHAAAAAIEPVLLGLLVILVAARLGGRAAERVGQPAVLGELLAGVALGNLPLLGFGGLAFLGTDPGIATLAEIGVILLLFEVGVGSDVAEMAAVGWSSLLVACLGVIVPFFLGWGLSAWLLPAQETLTHVFIGATLCATSVGITARVLADLGRLQAPEARIILGAAVIDDVFGLVILAVVTGVIQAANTGSELQASSVLWIVAKALIFLFGAIYIGGWAQRRLLRLASRLQGEGMLLVAAVGLCFLLAWLASRIHLAPIVGAFAAGLVLDEVHFHDARAQEGEGRRERRLEELLAPIGILLVPVFFVRMGLEVDLRVFARWNVLAFAAVLTVVAALGKLACAAGVLERGRDRLSVAIGMVPRGEVGLIFAGIGVQLVLHGSRVVSPPVFSAVVIMVIVTTLMTPLLAMSLRHHDRRTGAAPGVGCPPMATVASSSPRRSFRERLDHLLHEGFANEESPLFHVVNTVLVTLIFVSVVSVALETVQSIYTRYQTFFDVSEIVIVSIFTLEYLINIYVAHDRKRYIFGPWGIIDLLAIVPSWLYIADLRALKVGRVLRVVRFLRLMRILRALKLAKVAARASEARRERVNTLKMDVQIYLLALFSAVAIFSTLVYFAEERVPNTQFTSIPQAMWWCIATLTTTGYGDMYPTTVLGRFLAALTMLAGLALFGLLINVVGKVMLSSLFGASDLESHDEAARNAASLIAARRRRLASRHGGEGVSETTGKILLGDAAETMLLDGASDCACGRALAAEWLVCPYCGRARGGGGR